MTTTTHPSDLAGVGRLRDALQALGRLEAKRDLTLDESVLKAQLLTKTGDVTSANEIAARLLTSRKLALKQTCDVFEVLGHTLFCLGDYPRGVEHFRRGIRLAAQKHALASECALRIRLLRCLTHYVGPQAAAQEVAVTKRRVQRLGDPAAAIELRVVMTELEAKLGYLERARAHLTVAQGLLASHPHPSLEADALVVAVALTALDSDLASSYRLAERLYPMAVQSGDASFTFSATVNLAHLSIDRGDYGKAHELLDEALRIFSTGASTEIAIRDTMVYLGLARGDLKGAAATLRQLEEMVAAGAADSYFGLWHLLNRCLYLLKASRHEQATEVALDALPRIERMADRHLFERVKLLAAEGLALSGKAEEAAQLVAEAVLGNAEPPLERTAEAARVSGRLAALDDPAAAQVHFGRAARILAAVGNATARRDVLAQASAGLPKRSRRAEAPDPLEAPVHVEASGASAERGAVASRAIHAAAALIDLARHPALLGQEALALIDEAGIALAAAVLDAGADGLPRLAAWSGPSRAVADAVAADPHALRIPLGATRDGACELAVGLEGGTADRLTLLAVERLVHAARSLHGARVRERDQAALWPEKTAEEQLGMVFASEAMVDVVKAAHRVAAVHLPVLVTGEAGTGKELLARAIHEGSPRREQPFITFACAAVAPEAPQGPGPARRGAFSGMQDAFADAVRAAAGGTLFLDEVSAMAPELQPRLLRVIETGEIHVQGRAERVDVRIAAATTANLEPLVSLGRFREDLYYRLSVVRLQVPALRERREEVPVLVEHFLEAAVTEANKTGLRVADETMEYLMLYRWPGNVRQLAEEVRRMVGAAASGAVLMPEHLSPEIAASRRTRVATPAELPANEILVRVDQPMAAATDHVERAMIRRALDATGGKVDEAARLLGLSKKGLALKRQRLGL